MEAERVGAGGLPDLMAVAFPDLYRRNAFRVLGLAVDATPRQLRRRHDEVRAAQRLGRAVPAGGVLPLSPAPTAAEMEEALQRLRDPVRRIVEELFWFWPLRDDPSNAKDLPGRWRQRAGGRREGGLAAHNLAVLEHARALDAVAAGARHQREVWREVYRHWRRALGDDACWRWLERRTSELDDPRVGPELLLRVHAEVALRDADAGRPNAARQHVALIRSTGTGAAGSGTPGLGAHAARRALTAVAEPVVARLRARCDRPAAGDDPDGLSYAAGSLLTDTRPDLTVLRILLSDDDPAVVGAADEVASRVNGFAVAAANGARHKLAATKRQLAVARELPITPQLDGRVASNLGVLVSNQITAASGRAVELAEAQPADGAHHAYNLLHAARPLLDELRDLPVDLTRCRDLQDEVAGAAMVALTEYVKETGNIATARRYLREVAPLAVSRKLRDILREALAEPRDRSSLALTLRPDVARRLDELARPNRTALPEPPPSCPLCGRFFGTSRGCRVELAHPDRERRHQVVLDGCEHCWHETLRVRPRETVVRWLAAVAGRLGWHVPWSDRATGRRVRAGRWLFEDCDRIAGLTAQGWHITTWSPSD